ncbi:TetR/AcrR family transcriptional regulator [Arthrobacter sp. ISL-95]|uniref:TetR/AcrR family transcriptional regulator n=1 Tax=Arthrobacter sp. ISL-95 TaxID=2819116 RepID=UPI001BE62E06|nr:TetR/AcrR family transcriptional regulator [Arthrobacter sp. ISL-95]MBT2585427.1 TetR/AcrR family transcriptional regulator [Arthrobacter sp. ISL-95]
MAERASIPERVLNPFESILIESGERAATVDAVARFAGVSKGGLLHYFPNREALVSAQLGRFDELVSEDFDAMRAAPDGPVAYFLQTSFWSNSPLDRAFVAVNRLSQVARSEIQGRLMYVHEQWLEILAAEVGPELALAIRYIGDGLFFNAVFHQGEEASQSYREAEAAALLHTMRKIRSP